MKSVSFIKEWKHAPLRYWDWSFTHGIRDDITLYYGSWLESPNNEDGLHIFLDLEVPNQLCAKDAKHRNRILDRETKFDKILAINPFICKIRNDALGEEKYIHVFYPVINEKNILQNFEKKYDLYFTGNVGQTASVFSKLFFPLLMGVSNHVVVGGGQGEESKFNFNLKSVDFYEKFMINASSKVSLTYDIQSNPSRFAYMKSSPIHIPWKVCPWGDPYWVQYKARTFDAFFSKSISLHYKDDYKIMENFCEPNKHFIYFENKKDFEEKYNHIINNYESYQPMIEETYQYAVDNFTLEAFFKKYLKEIK